MKACVQNQTKHLCCNISVCLNIVAIVQPAANSPKLLLVALCLHAQQFVLTLGKTLGFSLLCCMALLLENCCLFLCRVLSRRPETKSARRLAGCLEGRLEN